MALIAARFGTVGWPVIVGMGYLGFVASELLLLGIWVGLGNSRRWTRLCGMLFGIAWLCFVFLAGVAPQRILRVLPDLVLVLSVCTIGVSGSMILFRKTIASIEYQAKSPLPSTSKDLQFNLKSLLWLTAMIGSLLTIAGTVRSWGFDQVGTLLLAFVLALVAVLEAWSLIWASLSCHYWVRVLFALIGVALIALLPPYCFGARTVAQITQWPSVSVVTAIWTLVSLYVIRGCGYRLVRLTTRTEHNVAEVREG